MSDMSDDHHLYADALGPYVLGALREPERAELEHHLRDCPRCRREAAELQLAAEALPQTVAPLQAPLELKARIMSTVRSEAELLRAAGSEADRVATPRRRKRGGLRTRVGISATAATVAIGAAAIVVGLQSGPEENPRVVAANITDPELARRARASVLMRGDHARLRVQGLRILPARHVYQVWVKPPAREPAPAGATFTSRTASVDIPRLVRRGERVMVSVEPAPGSRAPTAPPIIVAQPA